MNHSEALAKQYHDLIEGGNIAGVGFKEVLRDVTWQEATTQIGDCNTINTLVYHVQYYVKMVTKMLEEGQLEGNDAASFVHEPVTSKEAWETLLNNTFHEAKTFTKLLAQLPEKRLSEPFKVYGTYYRNLHGLIEHTYYHLGQMRLLKKLIRANG